MSLVESAGAAFASNAGASVTSGSFTPTAGGLLVALGSCGNGNNATVTGLTCTDSVSGTWTRLVQAQTSVSAQAAVFVKDAGAAPSAQTVTFTATSSGSPNECGIIVRQFAGARPAAQQTGATATSGSSAQASGSLSVTPTVIGAQLVGAYGFSTAATVMTANGNSTLYGQVNAGGCTAAEFEQNALVSVLTSISLGVTQASGSNVLAIAEILPASFVAGPPYLLRQAVKRAAFY